MSRRRVLADLDSNLPSRKRAKPSNNEDEDDDEAPPFPSAQPPPPPSSSSPPPSPSASPDPPALTIELRVLALFHALPSDHPIFGTPAQDQVRLPMAVARKNGQSWSRWCERFGDWVEKEMGELPAGACWMSKVTQIDIRGPENQTFKKVQIVRLLAFLAAPTQQNWVKLSALASDAVGSRPIDSPFSHACGNGSARAQEAGCINGLDHGRFATRDENESHKSCANGALALCPGHGRPPVKCIFVHSDGTPKPCRMQVDCVPACRCERKCFG